MDNHIKKVYVPMTETGFYILLCLREEAHGYSIVKKTESLTHGEIKISPGTLYGSLSKTEKDGLIKFIREEEIFCDDASRLDVMKQVFKQRMLPLLCIFLLIIIPEVLMRNQIDTPANHVLMVIFGIMFGLYLVLLIKFAIQFWKYFESIHK